MGLAARTGSAGRPGPLYTGSAIVDGTDRLERSCAHGRRTLCALRYIELDPDIFGEQLDEPGYEDVERIAAVGAVIERPEGSAPG